MYNLKRALDALGRQTLDWARARGILIFHTFPSLLHEHWTKSSLLQVFSFCHRCVVSLLFSFNRQQRYRLEPSKHKTLLFQNAKRSKERCRASQQYTSASLAPRGHLQVLLLQRHSPSLSSPWAQIRTDLSLRPHLSPVIPLQDPSRSLRCLRRGRNLVNQASDLAAEVLLWPRQKTMKHLICKR